MVSLLGSGDELMRVVEASFPAVDVLVRGNEITLTGPPADMTLLERVIDELVAVVRTGQGLTAESVERTVAMLRDHTHDRPADVLTANILSNRGRTIRPKTLNQKRYVDAIDRNTITFAIGPAGTGKTYLAVATAVDALARKRVRRIILARPAVEAGENLGFLPGDLQDKVDPYLRPLYDALEDMMPRDRVQKAIESRTIEIAPLAYMRGRTLGDAFVILDEAQNATGMQMKMFLTRLGVNSRAVITGDKTQIDLPNREDSGLLQVERILPGIEGIGFCYLADSDVVRHRLVRDIIRAYAEDAQG
jgi:phosphate starvation-inducible PhoH-like protein